MFKSGDTILCINDSLPANYVIPLPIKKGNEYTIRNVRRSPCCGYLWVDVGFSAVSPLQACISCNKEFITDGAWWFDKNRFAPIDTVQMQEVKEFNEKVSAGQVSGWW